MNTEFYLKAFKIIFSQFLIIQLILNFIPTHAGNTDSDYELENSMDVLPYPFSRGSAVWVEEQECIYIFGGRNETDMLDRIMKYTPADNVLTFLDTKLPTRLMGSTAVYNGEYIYIFGGKDYDYFYNTTLRFDPKTETITNMTAVLPQPTVGAAAVWTDDYIYFFGGSWGALGPQKFDTILRYDPEMDNITIMNSKLLYGRSGLAAAWDGKYIYIIGGSDGRNYSAEILRYSPENDTLTSMPGTLPTGRKHIQAEYHDGSIYIFGGRENQKSVLDDILRYDLASNTTQLLNKRLPNPSELRMYAYDGETIYIIGGFNGQKDINQFVEFYKFRDASGCAACSEDPLVNPYVFFGVVFVVLICAIGMNWVRNRKTKEE